IADPALDTEAQALFEEARHRRRRRWLVSSVVVLVLGGMIAGAAVIWGGNAGPSKPAPHPSLTPSAQPSSAAVPGATELAWIASGGLHLGNPSQGTDRLVAHTSAAASTHLVHIGSRVYFFERS